MAALTGLPGAFDDWVGRQRWYRANGSRARLLPIGMFRLIDPLGEAEIETHFIEDVSRVPAVLYQVPLTYRRRALPQLSAALVGVIRGRDGDVFAYDGPADPAYARALLELIGSDGRAAPTAGSPGGATGVGLSPAVHSRVLGCRAIPGEQSNTSVILTLTLDAGGDREAAIYKLFRVLAPGENPDIELQQALKAAGCRRVPELLGYVSGTWSSRESGDTAAKVSGHLGFLQEFIADAEDGWSLAVKAAAAGEDFSGQAFSLGAATAEVHELLAATMGTEESSSAAIRRITDGMRKRLETALAEVPELLPFRDAAVAGIETASVGEWPAVQRIHGDLHLGQVILSADRGWLLLDFEGEPLKPLGDRSTRDLCLRDLAGMLRSLDYAAQAAALAAAPNRVGGSDEQGQASLGWGENARRSFLAGYRSRSGTDITRFETLMAALELDKALYETIYESRHRPAWLPIPLTAIRRLVKPKE